MGLAIVWIFLFHSRVQFDSVALTQFKELGFAGVDLFVFLSGYGLTHSALKRPTRISRFYLKRLGRIGPPYLIAVALALMTSLMLGDTVPLREALEKLSATYFLLGHGRYLWFIPTILLFYLGFPYIFKGYLASPHKRRFTATTIGACYLVCLACILCGLQYYLIALARVPIFILGIHLAHGHLTDPSSGPNLLGHTLFLVIVLTGIVLLRSLVPEGFRHATGLNFYPLLFFTYSCLLLIARLLAGLATLDHAATSALLQLLGRLGGLSLELYLVHEHIIFPLGSWLIGRLSFQKPTLALYNPGRIPEYFLYFLLSLLLAAGLRQATATFRSRSSHHGKTDQRHTHPGLHQ
jgi:peptidoglycan/LPS O-acetylase OafA/YrhL